MMMAIIEMLFVPIVLIFALRVSFVDTKTAPFMLQEVSSVREIDATNESSALATHLEEVLVAAEDFMLLIRIPHSALHDKSYDLKEYLFDVLHNHSFEAKISHVGISQRRHLVGIDCIPSSSPSGSPTISPSNSHPTSSPSTTPSGRPSNAPSIVPSMSSVTSPSSIPSGIPSCAPSHPPTSAPSGVPSAEPSSEPSSTLVEAPTSSPSSSPSNEPSFQPSSAPSGVPSMYSVISPSAVPSGCPSSAPSVRPTGAPSGVPSESSVTSPSSSPSSSPSGEPSGHLTSGAPTSSPSSSPSNEPSCQPSSAPSGVPSAEPSSEPSSTLVEAPTSSPSSSPSNEPSFQPSSAPSGVPSDSSVTSPSSIPSGCPSRTPSDCPAGAPSGAPSGSPTLPPSALPSTMPSGTPSGYPSSAGPSSIPSGLPSSPPTALPSSCPSAPTTVPSSFPSLSGPFAPTAAPSGLPSDAPSTLPSASPSAVSPSSAPSSIPSNLPSASPTSKPSGVPSHSPSGCPSASPTRFDPSSRPSSAPSGSPTGEPSSRPTEAPSALPSIDPSASPTTCPSSAPSSGPSGCPSTSPSSEPSSRPSSSPSQGPSGTPSSSPSSSPSRPTATPTSLPSLSGSAPPSGPPSSSPSSTPSARPSVSPSHPSSLPSSAPTSRPSDSPTFSPSTCPSATPSSPPSLSPSQPSSAPSAVPSAAPSECPTIGPSSSPTVTPSAQPSSAPSHVDPTSGPSSAPSGHPSGAPTSLPSVRPTCDPSAPPSASPTHVDPTALPSGSPSNSPSGDPSSVPSARPSLSPSTGFPTGQPTSPSSHPSSSPTVFPSGSPTSSPSHVPSCTPSTSPSSLPSSSPSCMPTSLPTAAPSTIPSCRPSGAPSSVPTSHPSHDPSSLPTSSPSAFPSADPSSRPSRVPTSIPSSQPSGEPSSAPSMQPSSGPTGAPSCGPSSLPTLMPLSSPSAQPSKLPTAAPTGAPTSSPSSPPSRIPSSCPSVAPSGSPSVSPSSAPSFCPTSGPTSAPSATPSAAPTSLPSCNPSSMPSSAPTESPSSVPTSEFNWYQLGSSIYGGAGDNCGSDVTFCADGTHFAVGCTLSAHGELNNVGEVKVFEYDDSAGEWNQKGLSLFGEGNNDRSGAGLSLSLSSDGGIIAIGADKNDGTGGANSGHVRVFNYSVDSSEWVQLGSDIDGEVSIDLSGRSVSLSSDGSRVAIGAPRNDNSGNNAGNVRIFEFNVSTSNWAQVGADINGESADDNSGSSVSLSSSGSIVAIGSPFSAAAGTDAGQVRVFNYSAVSAAWTQMGSNINGAASGDRSGYIVSLSDSGLRVAISSHLSDAGGTDSGSVRVFAYNIDTDSWSQFGSTIVGESAGDLCGWSLSLSGDGDILAIGAQFNSGGGTDAGHVRVFTYSTNSSDWEQIGTDIDGEQAGETSGVSVSLSQDGQRLAIGAPLNDWNGTDAGSARAYQYDVSALARRKLVEYSSDEASAKTIFFRYNDTIYSYILHSQEKLFDLQLHLFRAFGVRPPDQALYFDHELEYTRRLLEACTPSGEPSAEPSRPPSSVPSLSPSSLAISTVVEFNCSATVQHASPEDFDKPAQDAWTNVTASSVQNMPQESVVIVSLTRQGSQVQQRLRRGLNQEENVSTVVTMTVRDVMEKYSFSSAEQFSQYVQDSISSSYDEPETVTKFLELAVSKGTATLTTDSPLLINNVSYTESTVEVVHTRVPSLSPTMSPVSSDDADDALFSVPYVPALWAVVGAVLLVLIIIICLIYCFCCRGSRKAEESYDREMEQEQRVEESSGSIVKDDDGKDRHGDVHKPKTESLSQKHEDETSSPSISKRVPSSSRKSMFPSTEHRADQGVQLAPMKRRATLQQGGSQQKNRTWDETFSKPLEKSPIDQTSKKDPLSSVKDDGNSEQKTSTSRVKPVRSMSFRQPSRDDRGMTGGQQDDSRSPSMKGQQQRNKMPRRATSQFSPSVPMMRETTRDSLEDTKAKKSEGSSRLPEKTMSSATITATTTAGTGTSAAGNIDDEEWEEKYSESKQRKYWKNKLTRKSSWKNPYQVSDKPYRSDEKPSQSEEKALQRAQSTPVVSGQRTSSSDVRPDDEWEEKYSESKQRPYWKNKRTQKSTWKNPHFPNREALERSQSVKPAPKGATVDRKQSENTLSEDHDDEWEVKFSESKQRTYWKNKRTQKSTWKNPFN